GVRAVLLRLVSHLHPHDEAKTELLSLHWFGRLSTAERASLYESANQTRLSGYIRVERDHPTAGRSGANPNRNRSPSRGRTKGGSAAQARGGVAPGTGSRGEKQRTLGDGLPRGIADPCPTTAEDAGVAETDAGSRNGITITKDGGSGRSKIPATGREPGGIPQQVAGSGRRARHCRATADFATPGEGRSRWRQHDYAPPFDPDSAIRARVKRITRPVFRCHGIKAEPRLSFAFGESPRRLWPIFAPTGWIAAWRAWRNRQAPSTRGTPTIWHFPGAKHLSGAWSGSRPMSPPFCTRRVLSYTTARRASCARACGNIWRAWSPIS